MHIQTHASSRVISFFAIHSIELLQFCRAASSARFDFSSQDGERNGLRARKLPPAAIDFQAPHAGRNHEESTMSKLQVLTPANSQLIFIDQQPQMAFGVQSIDRQTLKNNVVGLAKAARIFDIPTTITTVETESFSGNTFPELLGVFPENDILERTSMNSWDDQNVRDALAKNAAGGAKKIVVSGLWTEVCNTTFALSALNDVPDYEIYMVADASGGTSLEAHNRAMDRMVQAGVIPVTWQQVLLEWQRDWARKETYNAVTSLVKEHSGAYGMGIDYAVTHVHGGAERVSHGKRIGPNPAK